ncbi:MAG TPA: STAS-like domain-containing protein [Nostocaceae cyanobacterium]|nr:STAS-like domain-containing protein [Nostocaceae cyanobacterium]
MNFDNNLAGKYKQIFDKVAINNDCQIMQIIIPLCLEQNNNEPLITRSQARRLLSKINNFHLIIFDFTGVETIGQAFADEIFRVFKKQHPEIEIKSINTNQSVKQMISRAENVT